MNSENYIFDPYRQCRWIDQNKVEYIFHPHISSVGTFKNRSLALCNLRLAMDFRYFRVVLDWI